MEYTEKLYTGAGIEPLRPYFCGRRLNAKDHRFGPTERAHFWMIYLKEGYGTFTMSGHTHRLTSGDMFIAYPNRSIQYSSDKGSVWSIYWIALDESGILPFLDMLGVSEECPVCHSKAPLSAEHTFESIFDKFSHDYLSENLMCTGLILQLLSHFTSDESSPAAARDHIDEALFFFSNHATESITVGDCARAIGLTPAYLSRLFHARMGITPTAWLISDRLERAAVLLNETKLTVSEISQAVGIQDPLYFSRLFSKKFGCSPKKFRK